MCIHIKGGVAKPNEMQQYGGRFRKKLGRNLTITQAVLLPKIRLRTTTGHYIVKYTL